MTLVLTTNQLPEVITALLYIGVGTPYSLSPKVEGKGLDLIQRLEF
jgi:hypothetical protein